MNCKLFYLGKMESELLGKLEEINSFMETVSIDKVRLINVEILAVFYYEPDTSDPDSQVCVSGARRRLSAT